MQPIMTVEEIHEFLDREFPQIHMDGRVLEITDVRPAGLTMRFDPAERHLRPGATISGPAMFMLTDVAAYAAILAHVGPVALAVTTSLNINFLRKPNLAPLFCDCRILKLGKRLAVIDTVLIQEKADEPVCQATATYSIPPR
ncbi:PaaI family thioesterase [Pseudorhizobium endolithicum]|uniref:PaaI family thioesterase n=1 Tax=Pseudorhizobium endolithicum TaxID=1191678 RepID=A0ABN7JNF3_9HYPH|nr:PaaI family thioesterase [Pseudorhizobium endolithicum]CAD7033006.1 PaaI family thioesterase [Pseudorhizobium endolithicum]